MSLWLIMAAIAGNMFMSFYDVQGSLDTSGALSVQQPVFRSGIQVVALSVSALDPEGGFLTGLEPSHFAVYEDGIRQDLAFFGAADVSTDLALLVDLSSSMSSSADLVRKAVAGLLKTLRPDDRAMLVGFSGRANVVEPLTHDISRVVKTTDALHPAGNTALYDTVYAVLDELQRKQQEGGIRRAVVVVLTDGKDTVSLLNGDDVIAAVQRSRVLLYTVAFDNSLASPFKALDSESRYVLRALAEETGGRIFVTDEAEDLGRIYDHIAVDIAQQYLLAYVPKRPPTDTDYRYISVRLTSGAEGVVRTRRGYSPSPRS